MKISTVETITVNNQQLIVCPVKYVGIKHNEFADKNNWVEHILISTKEENIKAGEYIYDPFFKKTLTASQDMLCSLTGYFKIIAQSKDLSPSTLQAIASGKINEQGEYGVVCEVRSILSFATDSKGNSYSNKFYQLNLDPNNHVTVVEKESDFNQHELEWGSPFKKAGTITGEFVPSTAKVLDKEESWDDLLTEYANTDDKEGCFEVWANNNFYPPIRKSK